VSERLKPIKARMLQCGVVDVDGQERENVVVLEAMYPDWRISGGVYYVVPEAAWDADHEAVAKAREAINATLDDDRAATLGLGNELNPEVRTMLEEALALLEEDHGNSLKLYVVGTTSSDPGSWSIWDELALVIAETKEQALRLSGEIHDLSSVHEVQFDRPKHLVSMTEPRWGDDL